MKRKNALIIRVLLFGNLIFVAAVAILINLDQAAWIRPAVAQIPVVELPSGHFEAVYALAQPASLKIEIKERNRLFPILETTALGTGFFISPDGKVLTAFHVIDGADIIQATDGVGQRYRLEVIGFDARNDLALLQADSRFEVAYLSIALEDVSRGEEILALGNSGGDFLQGRMGRVTGTDIDSVSTRFIDDAIELTAALNQGDSGGPVLNRSGHVVGVVSYISFIPDANRSHLQRLLAIIPGSGMARDYASYAVSLYDQSELLSNLNSGYQRDHPKIGIYIGRYEPNPALSPILGDQPGVLVEGIIPNSPAAKAGLRAPAVEVEISASGQRRQKFLSADVILAVNNDRVTNEHALIETLYHYEVDDSILLKVQRGTEVVEIPITLASFN